MILYRQDMTIHSYSMRIPDFHLNSYIDSFRSRMNVILLFNTYSISLYIEYDSLNSKVATATVSTRARPRGCSEEAATCSLQARILR